MACPLRINPILRVGISETLKKGSFNQSFQF